MPNLPNRNDRRKRTAGTETLIIPHITKDMLDRARAMAEQGASRAEIEQEMARLQQGAAPAAPAAPQKPAAQRIIPTSRPRHTDAERQALREQMLQEQQGQYRAEASRRTERTVRSQPGAGQTASDRPAFTPAHPVAPPSKAGRTLSQPARRAQTPPAPEAGEAPTRMMDPVHPAAEEEKPPAAPPETPRRPAETPQTPPAARRQSEGPRTRAEAEAELNEKIRSDHIWLSNPVLVRGLGLAPVVGAALDGERALVLCLACLLLVTFTRVLAVAVCHLSGNRFRPLIYSYAAAVLYIPVYVLLNQLFGNDLTMLGIYLPILIVEPAIVKRMEFSELEPIRDALRHGFNNSLGMCAALLIVGCLRELLGAGAVFGHVVLRTAPLPLAALPAGGFVLVGVIAAIWCALANAYTDYKHEEVRRLYANRKR